MTLKRVLVVSLPLLALAACAPRGYFYEPPPVGLGPIAGGVVGQTIAHGSPALGPNGSRRQFFDDRAGRYYYFDDRAGAYFWEDGAPRS
jgi:hypothetical protein